MNEKFTSQRLFRNTSFYLPPHIGRTIIDEGKLYTKVRSQDMVLTYNNSIQRIIKLVALSSKNNSSVI
jgi:hypothetical protein